jgi:hypothetical protein
MLRVLTRSIKFGVIIVYRKIDKLLYAGAQRWL